MPMKTRPRKLAGGFWAGSTSSTKPRPRRPRSAPAKTGLNKVEKKQVKKIIASRKELKYCPAWYNYDHFDPANYSQYNLAPILASSILPNVYSNLNGVTSIVGFQTGNYLNVSSQQLDNALSAAGSSTCMYPLGGYGMERGDTSTTIDGNEVYFNSGKINLQINSVVGGGSSINPMINPLCFRVIHVKAKKDAAGVTPNLTGQLFRNMTNDNAGFMSDMTQRQLFHDYSINRQRYTVLSDKRFKLCQPVSPDYPGVSANQPTINLPHPTQKNLTLFLDKPKKKLRMLEVDNGQTNAFEPTNYDYIHYVFVLCCREQVNSGQHSQTGKAWTITTESQSTYREA